MLTSLCTALPWPHEVATGLHQWSSLDGTHRLVLHTHITVSELLVLRTQHQIHRPTAMLNSERTTQGCPRYSSQYTAGPQTHPGGCLATHQLLIAPFWGNKVQVILSGQQAPLWTCLAGYVFNLHTTHLHLIHLCKTALFWNKCSILIIWLSPYDLHYTGLAYCYNLSVFHLVPDIR